VKKLQARGVPIDGIGSQAHLIAGNVASFTSAFNQLIAVGLDVAITELDIRYVGASPQHNLLRLWLTST